MKKFHPASQHSLTYLGIRSTEFKYWAWVTNNYCFGMMQKIITLRLNLKCTKQQLQWILTDLDFWAVPNSTFSVCLQKNQTIHSINSLSTIRNSHAPHPPRLTLSTENTSAVPRGGLCWLHNWGKFPSIFKWGPWKVIFPRGYFFSGSFVFIKVIVMTHCYTGEWKCSNKTQKWRNGRKCVLSTPS